MEELLVKINYLIREKLWCSIRTLCDEVSAFILYQKLISNPLPGISRDYRSLRKVRTPY